MRYRLMLTVAAVAVLGPHAADAQTRGDAGVTFSPAYLQYLDVDPECCPVAGWITLGSGRFRLHADYLRSHRHDEGHGNYPWGETCTPAGACKDITAEGRRASVQRADLTLETGHETNVLVSWRAVDRPSYRLHILFGGYFRHFVKGFCRAFDGPVVRIPTPSDWPPDYVVFRAELTAEERRQCADDAYTSRLAWPQAAVAVDFPIGSRYFLRADARLLLFRVGIGAGIRF